MRQPEYSGQFKRDVKLAQKRGKDMEKLKRLLSLLIDGHDLPAFYLDHPLKGNWQGYRDAHIEPDWLLIYKISEDKIGRAHV
jgi:mRNA interferase YafQ